MEEEKKSKQSFKLRYTATALNAAISTYENMLNGDIDYTPELKNAVQTSIKELCTAICVSIN